MSNRAISFTLSDGLSTLSLDQQETTEMSIHAIYELKRKEHGAQWKDKLLLYRDTHERFLKRGLDFLSSGFTSLDSSKPWLFYWVIHALSLLESMPDRNYVNRMIDTIAWYKCPEGGYAGGIGQIPHLAPTYAAVSALVECGTEEAYESIDRAGVYDFLMSVKQPEGGFRMHENGERDVRGVYCALSVASHLNILTPELTENVGDWIARCQTLEGGIGGDPYTEAHGGYAFCGLAALAIIGEVHKIDLGNFLNWVINKQLSVEGGFQGRTNKLVDACYSYWQAAVFPILDEFYINKELYDISSEQNIDIRTLRGTFDDDPDGGYAFDQLALQEYLLGACQEKSGGLKDKPGCRADYYHTCYALSGLSISQHNPKHYPNGPTILGPSSNLLAKTDPIYNVHESKAKKIKNYFVTKDLNKT